MIGNYGYTFFGLFLKSLKNADGSKTWTVAQVNAIPIGGSAIQVMFVWVWAILSDILQVRWQLIIVQTVLGLIPGIIMSIWTSEPNKVSLSAAYAGYFMNYVVLGTAPLLFSWLADMQVLSKCRVISTLTISVSRMTQKHEHSSSEPPSQQITLSLLGHIHLRGQHKKPRIVRNLTGPEMCLV